MDPRTAGHPSAMRKVSGLAIVFLLAACGGKIAGDGSASGARGTGGYDAPPASPAPPASASASASPSPFDPPVATTPPMSGLAQPPGGNSVEDACAAICERNGQCGADQPDCKDTCADEIRSAASCSAEASTYIHCYAQNLAEGCAALPPVCERAYCAYTTCAGKVVPDYCH